MKLYRSRPTQLYMLLALVVLIVGTRPGFGECPFVSGSTGLAGAFSPTANTTRALPPDGIFNFTTINIPAGVTVKFQRNQKNDPVYILATGNVTINGTIDVSGAAGSGAAAGMGGPGGFSGGAGGFLCGGGGLGPGGGTPGCNGFSIGYGSFGFFFGSPPNGYGNLSLTPLIGGSGGGGSNGGTSPGFGGGGGGGAILIASSATVSLAGQIVANGGNGQDFPYSGGGSGGAIRVIGNVIAGNGQFSAYGGSSSAGAGGVGRVRFEACDPQFTGGGGFSDTGPNTFTLLTTSPVFLSNVPTLAITAIGGVSAPSMPAGSYSAPADIALGAGTTVATVQLAATGIPIDTAVSVTVIPQSGQRSTVGSTALAGSLESSNASAEVTLPSGRSLITAQATVTIDGGSPLVIGGIAGEKIARVRVGASYGGGSSLTYITASGKEIPADLGTFNWQ